jgi:nitrogen fixation NifU-like protein
MTKDDLFKLLEELQNKIEYVEEKKFSKIVINEFRHPSNFGKLNKPNAKATIKGPCGDTMNIQLEIKNKKIVNASFFTDGCGPTIACGSMLTKIIKNKTLQEANKISSSDLLLALKGLPIENQHCTILATNTLKKAIASYEKN